MAEIPDNLYAVYPRSLKHGEDARPVILPGSLLDQVPAKAVTDRCYPMMGKKRIIVRDMGVMSGCSK